VAQRYPAHPVGQPDQVVLPAVVVTDVDVVAVVVVEQRLDHAVDHPVEQVLAAGHVAVQRHRLDPEGGAEAAHGQRGQAVLVDEVDRGLQDPFPVQAGRTGQLRGCRRALPHGDQIGIELVVTAHRHRPPPRVPAHCPRRPAVVVHSSPMGAGRAASV
jgi:hypothetical protein